MANCSAYNSTADALGNFTASAPIDSITCTFSSGWGAGMGLAFGLFVFGFMGLALSIRAQHPGPVLIAGILSASVMAASIPGIAAKIAAVVIFVGFAGAGLYLYQRAQGAL